MVTSEAAQARLAKLPSPETVRSGGGLWSSGKNLLSIILPMLAIMLLWELIARYGGLPRALLPPISDIFAAIARMATEGTLWADLYGTLSRLLKSVFFGIFAGTIIGSLMGFFRIMERMFAAPLNFVLAIPGTALFPLSMLWFGLTEMAIISILIWEVTLIVTLNTWTGVKTVDPAMIRAGRAFGASPVSIFWRVLVPGALPSIIAGYRLAFSRCWRILIVAEMLVSVSAGLGYRIYWGREFFNSQVVYGSLFVVGCVGLFIERAFLRSLEVFTVERWGTMRELN